MSDDYFHHPMRFPGNAEGPFYTTGHQCRKNEDKNSPLVWCGDCLFCEAPEQESPDLLAPLNEGNLNTYFIRQPRNAEEIERACRALQVCCVAALRYGGKDRAIIERLGNDPELCDYVVNERGELAQTVDGNGRFFPFADVVIAKKMARASKRWWEFWKR
jgi:hypothetical protein